MISNIDFPLVLLGFRLSKFSKWWPPLPLHPLGHLHPAWQGGREGRHFESFESFWKFWKFWNKKTLQNQWRTNISYNSDGPLRMKNIEQLKEFWDVGVVGSFQN